ncbi:PhzF family phenazine biosynthesis isomerase, partial [Dactylosporangium sp. NPDC049140]|uniref:PhzF family phenazine biosynthesis protein n=1 Tax=Dactylosporangium sp. NPDC049140 TaxID=3155647 RepID=UPI0033F23F08
MTEIDFAYVDVFASSPLTGAPLTLVPDADALTDGQMRAVAREFNQSETTFVLRSPRPDATWRLRSFTPTGEEVFGAGHNALGAWLWLASSGRLALEGGEGAFTQLIGEDILPVHVRLPDPAAPVVTMDQSAPVFGAEAADRAGLAAALGLAEDDLVPDRPARVVSTGAGHLLVPIRDRAAVDRAAPDSARLVAALREVGGEGSVALTVGMIEAGLSDEGRYPPTPDDAAWVS